jgi:hypothetical protein
LASNVKPIKGRAPMTNERTAAPRATGSCLCGAVRYAVNGPLRDVLICHCQFCRRMNTHVGAYAACAVSDLEIVGGRKLRWYRSSPGARRGFCSRCGSALFWEPTPLTHISISAGSLDPPTGLRIKQHIRGAQKGDYYEVPDNE